MAYRTVKQPGEAELVIKRSRFIGRCFPVADEQEALRLLEQVRRQHWDATHNCYAYSVGVSGACARYSDDGEPSGTAGLPMMETLRRSGVTDALVVVTRYFGGILLGAGGLVRAYSAAAAAAVRSAGEVEMRECVRLSLETPYPLWGRVEPLLRERAQLDEVRYEAAVHAATWVRQEQSDALVRALIDRTDGRVVPAPGARMLRPFPVEPAEPEEPEKE